MGHRFAQIRNAFYLCESVPHLWHRANWRRRDEVEVAALRSHGFIDTWLRRPKATRANPAVHDRAVHRLVVPNEFLARRQHAEVTTACGALRNQPVRSISNRNFIFDSQIMDSSCIRPMPGGDKQMG